MEKISLNKIADTAWQTAKKRIENGSTMEKDNLKHAAQELIEATEARTRWMLSKRLIDYIPNDNIEQKKEKFEDELMDVLICILIECKEHEVNIEAALKKCMQKNLSRALGIGDKL